MLGIFCSHRYVNVGTGYDDLWKCTKCGKITERNPEYQSSLFCDHSWIHHGCLDDLKKCVKCGKVAEEKPGDFAPW